MSKTFTLAFAALSFLASQAAAHTYVYSVNDNRNVIRHLPRNRNFPVADVSSRDFICGKDAPNSAQQVLPVTAGRDITLRYIEISTAASDKIIDPGHLGPCVVFMAKYTSDPAQAQWFKIWEDGYNGRWCVDRLRAARGYMNVPIPAQIESGRYILRADIITLHEANAVWFPGSNRGAQFYPNCIDLQVTGGQGLVPASTVRIPGMTTPQENYFNLYTTSHYAYRIPAPAVATYVSSGGSTGGDTGNTGGDTGNTGGSTGATVATINAWQFSQSYLLVANQYGDAHIGSIQNGAWVSFPATNIPSSGNYKVTYLVASNTDNVRGTIQLESAGGARKYGNLAVPKTNGWTNWTPVSHTVALTAGSQRFGLYFPGGGFNLKSISFAPTTDPITNNVVSLDETGSSDASTLTYSSFFLVLAAVVALNL